MIYPPLFVKTASVLYQWFAEDALRFRQENGRADINRSTSESHEDDQQKELKVVLANIVDGQIAVAQSQPSFDRVSDHSSHENSPQKPPEGDPENARRKHEDFERKRRRQQGGTDESQHAISMKDFQGRLGVCSPSSVASGKDGPEISQANRARYTQPPSPGRP